MPKPKFVNKGWLARAIKQIDYGPAQQHREDFMGMDTLKDATYPFDQGWDLDTGWKPDSTGSRDSSWLPDHGWGKSRAHCAISNTFISASSQRMVICAASSS